VDYLNRKQKILFWKTRVRQGIYTLGELNKEGFNKDTLKSDLYVNLRCMKIIKIRRICIWAAALQKIVILEVGGERQQIDDYEKGVVGRT
jgi:hypothetical protein